MTRASMEHIYVDGCTELRVRPLGELDGVAKEPNRPPEGKQDYVTGRTNTLARLSSRPKSHTTWPFHKNTEACDLFARGER